MLYTGTLVIIPGGCIYDNATDRYIYGDAIDRHIYHSAIDGYIYDDAIDGTPVMMP